LLVYGKEQQIRKKSEGVFLAIKIALVVVLSSVEPYQYMFFNEFIGGFMALTANLTDYWGAPTGKCCMDSSFCIGADKAEPMKIGSLETLSFLHLTFFSDGMGPGK
jgi:hypothetical protein